MKDLEGSARGITTTSVEDCVRFLRDVERYPDWHPEVVRRVEVRERDAEGNATRARGLLHVSVGPVVKDFDLVLAVTLPGPRTVQLRRIPHDDDDPERFEVTWRVEQNLLRLDVRATLSVSRFLPVTGIGDRLAAGFVSAATRALRG